MGIVQERLARALSEADAAVLRESKARHEALHSRSETELARREQKKAEHRVDSIRQQLISTQHDVSDALEEVAEAEEAALRRDQKFGQLVRADIEVVIAVDYSASMRQWHVELREAITMVFELFPRAARLKVGIVAYGPSPTETFQLSPLRSQDKEANQQSVASFLAGLKAENAYVNVPQAVQTAIGMMNDSANPNVQQILMLLGDTGPGEIKGETDRTTEQLLKSVRDWCSARNGRRVLALDAGIAATNFDPKQRRFFVDLGRSNQDSRIGHHSHDVVRVLFETAFRAAGEE